MSEIVSLEGKDKAAVLASLYNASKPLGMGFLQYDPQPMTVEEAQELLDKYDYFDYLKGRVMKVDLSGDELDPYLYDRDNGPGAAARAIEATQEEARDIHTAGVRDAATNARLQMRKPTQIKTSGTIAIATLGLQDVAEPLGEAVSIAEESLQ